MSVPKLSIVLPCWNMLDLTKQTIHGLALTVDITFELIIVNNGSTDETKEWLDTFAEAVLKKNKNFIGLTLVHNPQNRFWSAACNIGAMHSVGEFIGFVANDMLCGPGVFSTIVERLSKDPTIGAASPWLIEDHVISKQSNPVVYLQENYKRYASNETIIGWHQAPFQVVTRDLWEKVGEWDECMRTHLMDNDFGIRIELSGFHVMSYKDLIVYHFGSYGRKLIKMEPKFAKNDARYFFKKWNKHSYQTNSDIPNCIKEYATKGNYVSGRQRRNVIKWRTIESL